MKRLVLALVAVALFLPVATMAQEKSLATRDSAFDRPAALSFELLGRGGLYSLDFDYSLTDQLAIGAGFSSWSVTVFLTSVNIVIIPIYMNYYFTTTHHRPFVTAGFDIVSASATFGADGFTAASSGVAAVLGGGYEYRGEGGFLFRAAPYVLAGSGGANLWFGLSFGYAF